MEKPQQKKIIWKKCRSSHVVYATGGLLKSIISAQIPECRGEQVISQRLVYVPSTIEEKQDFMAWVGKPSNDITE